MEDTIEDDYERMVAKALRKFAKKMGWDGTDGHWLMIVCYRKPDDRMGINIAGHSITKKMLDFTVKKYSEAYKTMVLDQSPKDYGFRGMKILGLKPKRKE